MITIYSSFPSMFWFCFWFSVNLLFGSARYMWLSSFPVSFLYTHQHFNFCFYAFQFLMPICPVHSWIWPMLNLQWIHFVWWICVKIVWWVHWALITCLIPILVSSLVRNVSVTYFDWRTCLIPIPMNSLNIAESFLYLRIRWTLMNLSNISFNKFIWFSWICLVEFANPFHPILSWPTYSTLGICHSGSMLTSY